MRRWAPPVLLGLILAAAGGLLWVRHELDTPFYGGAGAESFVMIDHGSGTSAIADALVAGGALHRKLPFLLLVRWQGLERRLQAGEYRFSSPARPAEVAQRLVQGDAYFREITIPEGLTSGETIALLADAGLGSANEMKTLLERGDWLADLAPGISTLEGYLFPDTYKFSRRTTSEQILKTMVAQFRTRISRQLAVSPLPAGRTLPQVVILASMIEKEARTFQERRLVSSVMYNRVRLRIPLACDPTIIYALKLAGTYDGNLHKSDLSLPSPYNTYLHAGLPPGPIANPGIDSLQAALDPAISDYLYYVSKNDGTHVFSKDLRSHILAVARYQKRAPRAAAR